jgi:hypothetical protein
VDKESLKQRIEKFKTDYLNTPIGREHLRSEAEEPKEVRAIFEKLRARQKAGEDITDDTLRQLLPHLNTKGNRERKARISTWPCVTKDVKSWFEGAEWKKPEEWPAVAAWLLDIVEAGKHEDWERWRALAQQPIQKGFACGFITPIVHCLNLKLPAINSKVVSTYGEVAPFLGLAPEISPALHEYPANATFLSNLVERLGEFGLNGFDEWDIYCHWNVTKKLGGKQAGSVSVEQKKPPVAVVRGKSETPLSLDICEELSQAQHDTQHPDRFEEAVRAAFVELGLDCERIGGSGEADVVAKALLGDEGYSLVVDAKTSQAGMPRGGINYDPIKGHQEQHEAGYAIVVSPAFSQGHTILHAQKNAVGLLKTDDLIKLVKDSRLWGTNLYWLKHTLAQVGMIQPRLHDVQASRTDLAEAARAILHVFDVHHRGDESSDGLDDEAIFWLLKGAKLKFPKAQIVQIVQFLANPLVGVLERRESGYVLTLPAVMAHRRLASMADLLAINTESPDLDG